MQQLIRQDDSSHNTICQNAHNVTCCSKHLPHAHSLASCDHSSQSRSHTMAQPGCSRSDLHSCPAPQVVLVDPQGSGLYNRVTRGVMYTREEAENTRLRNPCDTITEGVGVNRITANFKRVWPGTTS